jgi:hypothetical protein
VTLAGRLLERDPRRRRTLFDGSRCAASQPAADLASEIVRSGKGWRARRDAGPAGRDRDSKAIARLGLPARDRRAQRSRRAAAVVAVGVRIDNDRIVEARVATSGLPAPRPAPATQAAVVRSGDGQDFAPALAALAGDIEPTDDWRASASYRLHLAAVLLGRALRGACDAARRNGG